MARQLNPKSGCAVSTACAEAASTPATTTAKLRHSISPENSSLGTVRGYHVREAARPHFMQGACSRGLTSRHNVSRHGPPREKARQGILRVNYPPDDELEQPETRPARRPETPEEANLFLHVCKYTRGLPQCMAFRSTTEHP